MDDTTNLFLMSNMSDSSVEQDTMFEEMQNRVGDLLKVSEQLARAESRIEDLTIQLESRNREFESETTAREKEFSSMIAEHERELVRARRANRDVREENEQLRREITELKNQIAEMSAGSEEDKLEEANLREHGMKMAIAEKDAHIVKLEVAVRDLETKNSINSNSFIEQQNDVRKLDGENQRLRSELRSEQMEKEAVARDYQQIQSEAKKLKVSLHDISIDYSALTEEKDQLELVLQQVSQSNERNIETIDQLDQQISAVLSVCGAKTVSEAIPIMEERNEALVDLMNKFPQLKKALRKMSHANERLRKNEADHRDIIATKTKRIEKLENELETTISQKNGSDARAHQATLTTRVGKSFASVSLQVIGRIESIKRALGIEERVEPSFRTLIRSVIVTKRWVSLVGTPREYDRAARSWWWLNSANQVGGDGIVNAIHALQERVEELETHKVRLEETLIQTIASKEDNECELTMRVEQLVEESQERNRQIVEAEDVIAKQIDEIGEKIEASLHEELCLKLAESEEAVQKLSVKVTRQEKRIVSLVRKLEEVTIVTNDSVERKAKAEVELHDMRELFDAQSEELELIYKELSERSKDVCCLERTLRIESESSLVRANQIASVVRENALLQERPYFDPATVVKPIHIGDRLHEMALSLQGTLCD